VGNSHHNRGGVCDRTNRTPEALREVLGYLQKKILNRLGPSVRNEDARSDGKGPKYGDISAVKSLKKGL